MGILVVVDGVTLRDEDKVFDDILFSLNNYEEQTRLLVKLMADTMQDIMAKLDNLANTHQKLTDHIKTLLLQPPVATDLTPIGDKVTAMETAMEALDADVASHLPT